MSFLDIIKWILIIIILVWLLQMIPSSGTSAESIIKIVLIIIIIIFVVNNFVFPGIEGMSTMRGSAGGCGRNYMMPHPYKYKNTDEDYIQSGLMYDYGTPGYYLINNGHYSEGTVGNDKIHDLISNSVLGHLNSQYNCGTSFYSYPYVGKSRTYLDWERY